MVRSRCALLVLTLAAIPFTFAACGGDGNEDEDQIRDAIEFAATSGDPAACTRVQTQRFNDQSSGESGAGALKACRRDAAEGTADSVEVSNIEIDGDAATAEAAATGSPFDGQTIEVALVKQGDQWKLDELTGFTEFDRDRFLAAIEKEFRGGEARKAADCLIQNLDELSDQELQDAFLNPSAKVEQQVFAPCFQGQ